MPENYRLQELVSRSEIAARVAALGEAINRDYAGREPTILAVLGGAFMFAADLSRTLARFRFDCRIDFVRLASYGESDESSGEIRLVHPPMLPVAGRDILVVEDIVDTGRTMRWLLDYLRQEGAASVRLCVFIDKKERREVPLTPDYVGFDDLSGFLVGYGLDYAEKHRNLPEIYTIEDLG